VHLLRPSIPSNTNTNAPLLVGTAKAPTKTLTQPRRFISTGQQRFAIKSITRFTHALKVSLLACSRAGIGGFVEHLSGCRKTRTTNLAAPSCSGQSERASCGIQFSGKVGPLASNAFPLTAARDA
jgi:hypothetical protein